MVGERGGEKPAQEIARDITGDIGGEGAACIDRATFLSEIGERQGECRGHKEALRYPKRREDREARRNRQERGWNRQRHQTQENAAAAVYTLTEERNTKSRDCHSDGGGIDSKTNRRRTHLIGSGQRRQNRLGGE